MYNYTALHPLYMTYLKRMLLVILQAIASNCICIAQQTPQLPEINRGVYSKEGFEKYKGKIEIIGDSVIWYDKASLRVYTQVPEYRLIFEMGIFYPSVLDGNYSGGSWEKVNPDSLTIGVVNFSKRTISSFEEITASPTPFTTKRFRFWVFTQGMHNPSEYLMDLTNYSATKATDLRSFIANSRITYIKFVTIIV